MLQAAATFSAGLLAGQGLGACREKLPGCRLRDPGEDDGPAFRLSVHVLAAASPEVAAPGLVARPQLRLEVVLGQSRKETEAAVFAGTGGSEGAGGAAASALSSAGGAMASGWGAFSCSSGGDDSRRSFADSELDEQEEQEEPSPWRFDDTLTFAAGLSDILGEGLRFRLAARSDMCLGPLQVRMPRVQDLGEAVLELRHGILAVCRPEPGAPPGSGLSSSSSASASASASASTSRRRLWQTPVLVVPLRRACSDGAAAAQVPVVSRISLTCSVNCDPSLLLRKAEQAERSLVDKVVDPCVRCIQGPECASLPFCGVGRLPSSCRARSPRPYCRNGSQRSGDDSLSRSNGYATCEVPASLVAGGYMQDDQEAPNGLWPALNGLWPAHPTAASENSSRWQPKRFSEAAPEDAAAAPAVAAPPADGGYGHSYGQGGHGPSAYQPPPGERLFTTGLRPQGVAQAPPPQGYYYSAAAVPVPRELSSPLQGPKARARGC